MRKGSKSAVGGSEEERDQHHKHKKVILTGEKKEVLKTHITATVGGGEKLR